MKTIFLFFILFFTTFSGQQKTLGTFIISDATINGNDVTETYLNGGGFISFYTTDSGELMMANVMANRQTQSFGRLYASKRKSLQETYGEYKADLFYFQWSYKNDYDNKRGTAKINFTKIYKPQGIVFICTIVLENLDRLVYKGYMDGTLDLSDY